MRKIIKRLCVLCGKEIEIELKETKEKHSFTYKGGHYFGRFDINGEVFEYWECDNCCKPSKKELNVVSG